MDIFVRLKFISLIVLSIILSGCAYSVKSEVSPAVNIYTAYEDKISGTVVLVLDDSINNINMEVVPSSHTCGAHKFILNLESSLALSVHKTTESIFENVLIEKSIPPKESIEKSDINGIIIVKLNRLYPTITFYPTFWSSHATATCDIILDIVVKDKQGRNIIVTTVGGSRSAQGEGGGFCEKGANVLSNAVSLSIRDVMERYAERLSNSEKIRKAFMKN